MIQYIKSPSIAWKIFSISKKIKIEVQNLEISITRFSASFDSDLNVDRVHDSNGI